LHEGQVERCIQHKAECLPQDSTLSAIRMKAPVVLILGAARPNAHVYLHVHSHHLGVVITKVRRSVTMLNNAMGVTNDRSTRSVG